MRRVVGNGIIGLLYSDVQLRRSLRSDVYELLALHSSIVVRSRIRAIGHHASHEVRLSYQVNCRGSKAFMEVSIELT